MLERPAIERDRRSVEAEVLDRLRQLGLHRRERLADVPRLDLRNLLAVFLQRVGECVQKTGALVRRRLAPRPGERGACGGHRAVDVVRPGHRSLRERRTTGGLSQVTDLARGGLDELAVDEEAVLLLGRDRHAPDSTPPRRSRPGPGRRPRRASQARSGRGVGGARGGATRRVARRSCRADDRSRSPRR